MEHIDKHLRCREGGAFRWCPGWFAGQSGVFQDGNCWIGGILRTVSEVIGRTKSPVEGMQGACELEEVGCCSGWAENKPFLEKSPFCRWRACVDKITTVSGPERLQRLAGPYRGAAYLFLPGFNMSEMCELRMKILERPHPCATSSTLSWPDQHQGYRVVEEALLNGWTDGIVECLQVAPQSRGGWKEVTEGASKSLSPTVEAVCCL